MVVIGDDVAASLGLKQHSRVRGTISGASYRSSIARSGGVMYLGVHKATVERAGLAIGDSVEVTIQLDMEPREIDIPVELERALEAIAPAKAAWDDLSPSTSGSMRGPLRSRKRRRPGPAGSRRRSMRCSGARS